MTPGPGIHPSPVPRSPQGETVTETVNLSDTSTWLPLDGLAPGEWREADV